MAAHKNLLNTIILFTLAESIIFLSLNTFADAGGTHHTTIRGPSVIMAGVPTDFFCSADCTPPCNYIWRVLGHVLVGPVLRLTVSGHQELLKLECISVHPVTKNSEKTSKIVTVDNPVQVKANTSSHPKEGQAFTLVCEGSGPNVTTAWNKDGLRVSTDSRKDFGEDNATLTFNPLLYSDGGFYDCVVTSDTAKVASRGYLLSLGTMAVGIQGPDVAEAGVEHIFTCQANCTLECTTSWWFSHGFPQGAISVLGDEIRWTPAGSGLVQEFECIAENSLAQRSVQATKMVTVPARPTTTPPSGSVVERPSVALVFLACLQMLFSSSI